MSLPQNHFTPDFFPTLHGKGEEGFLVYSKSKAYFQPQPFTPTFSKEIQSLIGDSSIFH